MPAPIPTPFQSRLGPEEFDCVVVGLAITIEVEVVVDASDAEWELAAVEVVTDELLDGMSDDEDADKDEDDEEDLARTINTVGYRQDSIKTISAYMCRGPGNGQMSRIYRCNLLASGLRPYQNSNTYRSVDSFCQARSKNEKRFRQTRQSHCERLRVVLSSRSRELESISGEMLLAQEVENDHDFNDPSVFHLPQCSEICPRRLSCIASLVYMALKHGCRRLEMHNGWLQQWSSAWKHKKFMGSADARAVHASSEIYKWSMYREVSVARCSWNGIVIRKM
ncbi:uncharacterized protein M437DRAFT_69109 [Aureobasidium melanogenum CBS 110374]|uniref:Uncharacterized protein n=1 Tax=Aureobasidium melanogenum (strain CBS 110374) TaxID=1043003 RepID=A0A074VF82_AURM1|nr:uncharacterized protein M437DRAFT_69109 [Aureobasidium melanogenum CBS 110374]KEQ59425.1 hypothetical protein M437DRAFT_69109 [Aureobasidium melanogenum CBS 110374]